MGVMRTLAVSVKTAHGLPPELFSSNWKLWFFKEMCKVMQFCKDVPFLYIDVCMEGGARCSRWSWLYKAVDGEVSGGTAHVL